MTDHRCPECGQPLPPAKPVKFLDIVRDQCDAAREAHAQQLRERDEAPDGID